MVLTVGAMAAGAGIYKWTMVTPEVNGPAWGAMVADGPAPTPEPTLNKFLLNGLLQEYVTGGGGSNPGRECLVEPVYLPKRWLRIELLDHTFPEYDGKTGNWTLRVTGDRCKGLETWEIDDATGAIKYLGSSTAP